MTTTLRSRLLPFCCMLMVCALCILSCKTKSLLPLYKLDKSIIAPSAAVVSAHPEATKIGLEVLRDGGNAVDAAIAVQFALAVCYPVAGNIGGGGFMIYRGNDGETAALDFREMAPSKAFSDMYLDDNGDPISDLSLIGHMASGVPGTVDGMVKAFEKYSKLKDWKRLVQPSVDLAANGFKLTERQSKNLNKYMEKFVAYNTAPNAFTARKMWKTGDLLKQTNLSKTMAAIRDQGEDGFYKGWVADKIVEEMQRGNGIISHQDLENYESKWRDPVIDSYKGHNIISMPPPSSGGIILVQMLKMIEPFDIGQYDFQSQEAVHLIVESERRAYADRAIHLGDPDYYNVPLAELVDPTYTASRMANFNMEKASVSDSISNGTFEESEQTTHFSIVDEYGNATSVTTTINTGYGSKVVVGGAGFLLNNEMDDFSAKPGVPNFFGLLGAEANKIEPGKRMLSSMTPTIIEKDNKLKLVVGTPGGSTIITSVYQVILNILEFEMTATDAVHSPRFHHQWKPDLVFLEEDCLSEEVKSELTKKGHTLKPRGKIGKVEAIYVRPDGSLEAVADTRADDHAMGY